MNGSLASKVQSANAALIAGGDLEAVPEFFAPDYIAHLTEQKLEGHDAIRGFLTMLQDAFPDLQIEVEVLVEGDERVAWQRTHRGTHQSEFMGFPASGREVVWRDMIVTRFSDGRIAEEWAVSDLAERLLAAIPKD